MTADTPTMRRILLADDNLSLRSSLAMALRSRGFEALEAGNGQKAFELGQSSPPDLSLLDINMPDMTGVDVLRRWISCGVKFPVIFMTAEKNANLRIEAHGLGAVGVLDKPFGTKEFMQLVHQALKVA